MIRSMTGYGLARETIDGMEISVEIKSVNHRYFEFTARTTRGYGFLEEKLKSFVQNYASRGKFDAYIGIQTAGTSTEDITVNHAVASGYVKAFRELIETYNLPGDINTATLSHYSDIFDVKKEPDMEIWESVCKVAQKAVQSLVLMREIEGEKLKNDVEARSSVILNYVETVEEMSPKTVSEYMDRLRERIDELLGEKKVDEQRLITEVAIFGDKVAVAEETVRLRSHFSQMDKLLSSDEPVGRKLDFLVQEMNREANTIGSKSQNAQLSHIVVEIKSEIEKIREQIQNME